MVTRIMVRKPRPKRLADVAPGQRAADQRIDPPQRERSDTASITPQTVFGRRVTDALARALRFRGVRGSRR